MEDGVAGAVKKLQELGGKSLVSAEWMETDGMLMFRGKVYVPDVQDLQRQIITQHHDLQVADHPGRWKTLELISQNYWWPHISHYISKYSKTCDLCLQTKAQRQMPIRELHLLPIPEECWDSISVDFVVELPDAHGSTL